MGPSKPRATNRPGEAASENEPVSPRNKADARLRGFALSCEIQCASRQVCIRYESLIEGKGKADNRRMVDASLTARRLRLISWNITLIKRAESSWEKRKREREREEHFLGRATRA